MTNTTATPEATELDVFGEGDRRVTIDPTVTQDQLDTDWDGDPHENAGDIVEEAAPAEPTLADLQQGLKQYRGVVKQIEAMIREAKRDVRDAQVEEQIARAQLTVIEGNRAQRRGAEQILDRAATKRAIARIEAEADMPEADCAA